jgi:hypothetical protein
VTSKPLEKILQFLYASLSDPTFLVLLHFSFSFKLQQALNGLVGDGVKDIPGMVVKHLLVQIDKIQKFPLYLIYDFGVEVVDTDPEKECACFHEDLDVMVEYFNFEGLLRFGGGLQSQGNLLVLNRNQCGNGLLADACGGLHYLNWLWA